MSQYNAQKNPPWVRNADFTVPQQPMMNPAVLQYPQTGAPSAYQAQIAIQHQALAIQPYPVQQMYGSQVSGIHPGPQTGSPSMNLKLGATPVLMSANANTGGGQGSTSGKQRVFTGTVTKVVDNNYGFVDENVFFQMSCVKGPYPVLNDRVLVEAVCLPNMPFKWNATRVQVLPMNDQRNERPRRELSRERDRTNSSYSMIPSPDFELRRDRDRGERGNRDRERIVIRRDSPPSQQLDHEDDERRKRRERDRREREHVEKERERERERDRERDREKERERERDRDGERVRERSRSRSPRRPRPHPPRKYRMRIPDFNLDIRQFTVNLLKSRYNQLYVPSDFFLAFPRWIGTIPSYRPLKMSGPAKFHIIDKEVEPVFPVTEVIDPPDADFLFCAKVMLISIPSAEELHKKCIQIAEDKDDWSRLVHPTRLIECLVGINTRSKNEYMAIGGPWSPSLDGADPVNDPTVLIKTAIRTCKALTGIDLTNCTKWYRFAEVHYRRGKSTYKGREVPARVETVVIYAPDIWSLMPSASEWDSLNLNYQRMLNKQLALLNTTSDSAGAADSTASAVPAAADDDKEDDSAVQIKEPTHYSLLDPKCLKVSELREELAARNLSPKGLRLQLLGRLSKALRQERKAGEEEMLKNANSRERDVKEEPEKKDEKEKDRDKKEAKLADKESLIESYKLPDTPHILVHPSRTAKNGKFSCKVLSLSILLDYTPDVTKEHSFEVAFFAENFNEMLMRDCGLHIYKSLLLIPDKDEEKDKEPKKDEVKEAEKSKEDAATKKEEDNAKVEEKMDVDVKDSDKTSESSKKVVNGKSDEDKEEKSRKNRRRHREKLPQQTVNPALLLAFSYFDVTHYGKITPTDLEDLLQTLGLDLSRAQVKKLAAKIPLHDGYLNYRLLTDQSIKPVEGEHDEPSESEPSLATAILSAFDDSADDTTDVLLGNRADLPKFCSSPSGNSAVSPTPGGKRPRRVAKIDESPSGLDEDYVMYKGALFNIENLNQEVQRNESARLESEKKTYELKKCIDELKEKQEKLNEKYKSVCDSLSATNKKLAVTEDKLSKESIQTDIYLTTLMDVQERILPVLDTDEIKRLIQLRQKAIGPPTINLVPLSKIEDILKEEVEIIEVKSNENVKKEDD